MDDLAFVSVAFGEKYLMQQQRMIASILCIYPEANIIFYEDGLPSGSRGTNESLYGFKPHAVAEARARGFKKVVWIDTAMILLDKIDELFGQAVVAVRDHTLLEKVISDRYLAFKERTRMDLKFEFDEYYLVGGSFYYFDFNFDIANEVLDQWRAEEQEGYFGSQAMEAAGCLQGHRHDETCMAMIMRDAGITPVEGEDIRYCTKENPMMIKQHFK